MDKEETKEVKDIKKTEDAESKTTSAKAESAEGKTASVKTETIKDQTSPAKTEEPVKDETTSVKTELAKDKTIPAKTEPASEPKNTKATAALIMSSIALVLGCAGLGLGWVAYSSSTHSTAIFSGTDGNSANFTEGSIAEIADKVSPSVVSIVTSTKAMNYYGQSYNSEAAGTGIIVTSDGYILTNKHVINGASKVTIVLDDGTTYENVKVVATDPLNDVAFLKIDNVSDLPAATLGDSKTITVGQQVIAIGNALGEYQNTVTAGIISGTGRSVTASDSTGNSKETLSDMIQTDAAINSGNSGGPLVNAAGQVIGINTATSETAENVGFAIPISSVKGMLNQLIKTGKAKRAYLGIYNIEITPEIAKAYNLPVEDGVYVYSSSNYSAIAKGSPAEKAGIKDKDIITKVNGIAVGESSSLSNILGEYQPGDVIELTIIREGNEMTMKVTLEGYED